MVIVAFLPRAQHLGMYPSRDCRDIVLEIALQENDLEGNVFHHLNHIVYAVESLYEGGI